LWQALESIFTALAGLLNGNYLPLFRAGHTPLSFEGEGGLTGWGGKPTLPPDKGRGIKGIGLLKRGFASRLKGT